MDKLPNCGFIGLGAMGAPMAGHLAQAACLKSVWNRSPEAAATFTAQHGVQHSNGCHDLAAAVDVIFICVSADQDLLAVVEQILPALKPGQTVVDTSTVSPATARQLAGRLVELGVDFADAPVSGGVEGARKGSLSVMVGAEPRVFERISPILACFASQTHHLGPVGAGQAAKAVNQVMVAGIAESVCEALALAERAKLPQRELLQVLTSGAANSWFLEHRGDTMLNNQFSVGFKASLLLKDLLIIQNLARELDIKLEITDQAVADYRKLVEMGHGDEDTSSLIWLKRGRDDQKSK